jgi:hypothetical protein
MDAGLFLLLAAALSASADDTPPPPPAASAPVQAAPAAQAPAQAAPAPLTGALRPEQVLVIYDSRIPDSVAVAEYYAGSDAVPEGKGNMTAARPGVLAFDLASTPDAEKLGKPDTGDIRYPEFITKIRNPIRLFITDNSLRAQIRCLVMTKGLPHRIFSMSPGLNADRAGDNPSEQYQQFVAGNATAASVDSELTLLWQDLESGAGGKPGDCLADGMIMNPYWRSDVAINSFSNANIASDKRMVNTSGPGQIWGRAPRPADARTLTPGDMYLVTRLDARQIETVIGMIERGKNVRYDTNTHAIVLDESGSNGITDTVPNRELDNMGSPQIWGGDDWEQARDLLTIDGRFRKELIIYDHQSGPMNFAIGPRLDVGAEGLKVPGPVIMLAHFGSNAEGPKPLVRDAARQPKPDPAKPGERPAQPDASDCYAESFDFAPGAIFNSMESFNGRDFGGLGGWSKQQQAAGFLAAGGTFAVVSVWEPFSVTLPDNAQLVRNFVLGNLTWAEAAHTALPVLSWQQIVIGDPLARAVRSSEDLNTDGTIDDKDLEAFDTSPKDLNRDGTPSAKDRQLIETAVNARKP